MTLDNKKIGFHSGGNLKLDYSLNCLYLLQKDAFIFI